MGKEICVPVLYLLSDHVRIVTGLDFEGAIVGPEVDRVGDAGHSSLVDHLCRLGPRDRELEVCILFPVSEEEREFGEETIVKLARRGDGLRTRIAVETALQRFGGAHQLLPILKVVWIFRLRRVSVGPSKLSRLMQNPRTVTYHFGVQLLEFGILLLCPAEAEVRHGGRERGTRAPSFSGTFDLIFFTRWKERRAVV